MTERPETFWGFRQNPRFHEWAAAAGVAFALAVAVVSPFFFFGMASGHDIAFHMASWLDVAGQWKQGIAFPRWAEWANFGYGEPRFVFYPPLSWLFGAFLGTFLPWKDVGAAFFICTQTFAGLSAYALLRRISKLQWGALFGAACFAVNPYALTIIYARSDFAELLAIAFFPPLLLTTLRLCGILPADETLARGVAKFALAFCAVWLCNAPAAVIATYSAGVVFLIAAVQKRRWEPLVKGAAGILLGFGLAAFYIIPAIWEQKWVNIAGALGPGLAPASNFLYSRTADSEHDLFNRIASNIAMIVVVWALLGGIANWRSREAKGDFRKGALPAATILSVTAFLLMLPITGWLWRILPELKFVQFPWRWMSIVALCGIAMMTASIREKSKVWLLLATIAVGGSGAYLGNNTWWDTEDMPSLQQAIEEGTGFEGTDEYDPTGDDHTDLPQRRPRAWFVTGDAHPAERKDSKIFTDVWTAERRELRVVSAEKQRVAIRLVDYPAWQVTVNRGKAMAEHAPGTAQMIVHVPAGESRIEIRFGRTLDRTIGGWISILTASGCLGLFLYRRDRQTSTRN